MVTVDLDGDLMENDSHAPRPLGLVLADDVLQWILLNRLMCRQFIFLKQASFKKHS